MTKKLTMYMVTHKKVKYIPKDRTPIFVGSGDNYDNYLTDSTGDNISNKNKNYCELTALYWIWKNDMTSDYVCIEHYRRFFLTGIHPIRSKKMLKILNDNLIILSKNFTFKDNIFDYYDKNHVSNDLKVVRSIIMELCPEYLDTYDSFFAGHQSHMLNMMCCSKVLFDNYCEWLFPILFKLEERIDISDRDDYQKRVFGFLSERLLNVWVQKNKIKFKDCNIYYLKENKLKSILYSIYKK